MSYNQKTALDILIAAVQPFLAVAEAVEEIDVVSSEEQYIWRASRSKGEQPGISVAHLRKLQRAMQMIKPLRVSTFIRGTTGDRWEYGIVDINYANRSKDRLIPYGVVDSYDVACRITKGLEEGKEPNIP